MASWLKAAEGLFEVVDRKAKLVVSELAEEQSDSEASASNEQGSEAKRTKPKRKPRRRQSTDRASKASDTVGEQTVIPAPQAVNVTPEKEKDDPLNQNDVVVSEKSVVQKTAEQIDNLGNDPSISGIPKSEAPGNDSTEIDSDCGKVQIPITEEVAISSTSNSDLPSVSSLEAREGNSSLLPSNEIKVANENHTIVVEPVLKLGDSDVPPKTDQETSQSEKINEEKNNETPVKVADNKVEATVNQTKQEEQKPDTSPQKEQDQLDEAQGLLKSAISTGQSKEARLARVCAGLSSRLQEYKAENAQLEELLVAERELSKSYEAHIKQLQQDLLESKSEVTRVETSMVEALAAKNSEIETLVNSMDALKKQAALSEGSLASLQANMESIMRNRELTETRMMQALREELASAERRAEEERSAHNATKMASMEREVELEHRAIESSTALARIQRIADERTAKAAELEQKLALLEVECANLNQDLQDMEARVRRGQKKAPEEANQAIQAWQEEVERARQGQRDAESKLSSLDAELQKMRIEMAAMKRDAEHYSRQEHMELEKRYRELTDLLYFKQTQLETTASEKAAAEFQLEKELKRLHEAQAEVERSRVSRRPSSSWEEDTEIKTLETLPLHHRHMDGARVQLQKAAKLLDSGAVRATRFLWRYPTARVSLLFYLVFVHLFLMYLLHRLQEQADELSAIEAKFMGLSNPTLP